MLNEAEKIALKNIVDLRNSKNWNEIAKNKLAIKTEFKNRVLEWAKERNIDGIVRTELTCYYRYNSFHFDFGMVSLHNGKGAIKRTVKWLNKISVSSTEGSVLTHSVKTDENMVGGVAKEFGLFVKELTDQYANYLNSILDEEYVIPVTVQYVSPVYVGYDREGFLRRKLLEIPNIKVNPDTLSLSSQMVEGKVMKWPTDEELKDLKDRGFELRRLETVRLSSE